MSAPHTDHRQAEWAKLVAAVHRRLELEEAFGAQDVPFDRARTVEMRDRLRKAAAERRTPHKAAPLAALEEDLQNCCRCALGSGRGKLVFGAGNPDADLMFIGEAPGYHEDRQGIPFIGPAGQLLTKIIEAIGLTREQVYIANICKCRPPNNRTPTPDESAACIPFLHRQIDIIQPRIIVTLGNPATRGILQTSQGITRARGRFTVWRGIEVMPTFHPSYLLRKASAKREVWEDMQKVWHRMRELGLQVGTLQGGRTSS